MENQVVLTEIQHGGGWATLNRPEALNAFNSEMFLLLSKALEDWEANENIHYVVLRGNGRAFCAGGDLMNFSGFVNASSQGSITEFLEKEFGLNLYIHNYSKPYISILDGITMGGGMGLSIHGTYRVVTEKTLMAMPETSIGFFPDVGGAWFLNRCPGKIGLYLALTSSRISPADAIYTGLGTHYMSSENIPNFLEELRQTQGTHVADTLSKHHQTPEAESFLMLHQSQIDSYFNQPNIEMIFKTLDSSQTEFAKSTLERLKRMCPNSLRKTFDHITAAENMTMEEVTQADVRLAQSWTIDKISLTDWFEGIRAAVIDKDQNPKWVSPPIAY